jgi:hypothetical protein
LLYPQDSGFGAAKPAHPGIRDSRWVSCTRKATFAIFRWIAQIIAHERLTRLYTFSNLMRTLSNPFSDNANHFFYSLWKIDPMPSAKTDSTFSGFSQ